MQTNTFLCTRFRKAASMTDQADPVPKNTGWLVWNNLRNPGCTRA